MVGKERRQPLRHFDQHQKRNRHRLRRTTAPAPQWGMDAKRPLHLGRARGDHAGLQRIGDQANLALLVDGADRGLRKARISTQLRSKPGSKQRMAAQITEKIERAANRLAGE